MKILFYSPFGSRTGSDMMLWYIIHHLDKKKHSATVYSERKWNFFLEQNSGIPYYSSPFEESMANRVKEKVLRNVFNYSVYEKNLLGIFKTFKPDLIYINTLYAPNLIPLIRKTKIPFVVHFHELDYSYQLLQRNEMKFFMDEAALIIGCSQIVCEKIKTMGAKKVELFYECIDLDRIQLHGGRSDAIRQQYGLKQDDFLWVMSGQKHYRKGFDFFPAIGKAITQHKGYLMWIGKGKDTGYEFYVEKEIEKNNLKNIFLVDELSNEYFDYMNAADGFVLTSREDPFPLVMHEAAALGKPIVSFNSGGVKEFVTPGTGSVIEDFNVHSLCEIMIQYMQKKIPFNADAAKQRAAQFDILTNMQEWENIISKYF